MKKFSIPVTWTVWDKIEIEAETIEEAVKYVKDNLDKAIKRMKKMQKSKGYKYASYEKDEIKEAVETIAATASGGIKGEQLSTVSNALLNPLIGAGNMIGSAFGSVVEGVTGTLSWLAPTRYKKVKKEKTKK